jgi:hypothetical protein
VRSGLCAESPIGPGTTENRVPIAYECAKTDLINVCDVGQAEGSAPEYAKPGDKSPLSTASFPPIAPGVVSDTVQRGCAGCWTLLPASIRIASPFNLVRVDRFCFFPISSLYHW